MTEHSEGPTGGFQGVMKGVPLAALLQLWSTNHYSGLVSVRFQGVEGNLFFIDGELVHAEAEHWIGERAVAVILSWPDGTFALSPSETTLERTIHKKLSHLVLNAQRTLDERHRPPVPALTPPPGSMAPVVVRAGPSALDRVRAVPGVARAVRFGPDGRLDPGEGPAAEALAAKALHLATHPARAVAEAFGLRELSTATVQCPRDAFLVVQSHDAYMGVAVATAAALEPVADHVRNLLIRPVAT